MNEERSVLRHPRVSHDRLNRLLATVRRPLAAAALAALVAIPAQMAWAQDTTEGQPPRPDEEGTRPLAKQGELWPAIPAQFNRPVKDYHVVVAGDTLFDISGAYFGSPYVWPIVWSFNRHITNPHWIYPGDVVYLRAPLPGDAPSDSDGPDPFKSRGDGTSVALAAFYTERDITAVGSIAASPEAKRMMAFPDKVYLNFSEDDDKDNNEKKKRKVGKVYAVLRPEGDIRDPEDDDKVIGHKYRALGAVRVTQTQDDKYDTGVIVQSWEEIHRGDLLFPYERQLLRVAPAVATKTNVARIVDTVRVETLFGEHDYVFINLGSNDGVRVGNRFFAYKRFDGESDLDTDADDKLPWERLGQLIVIHTEGDWATALVTESRRELEIGMRLEMYEGY